jgi:hypothetical protein
LELAVADGERTLKGTSRFHDTSPIAVLNTDFQVPTETSNVTALITLLCIDMLYGEGLLGTGLEIKYTFVRDNIDQASS